jgi:hypothetical protein
MISAQTIAEWALGIPPAPKMRSATNFLDFISVNIVLMI